MTNAWLLKLPLDIYWELCSFLDPPALICLARVSKYMRSFLASPTSARIWKDSLERIRVLNKLPPWPPFLSGLEFAELVFHSLCHGCSNTCCTVIWSLHGRYCNDCINNFTTTDPHTVVSAGIRNDPNISLQEVVPNHRNHFGDCGLRRWLVSDLQKFSQQFASVRHQEKRQKILNDWRTFTTETEKSSPLCDRWRSRMYQIEQRRLSKIKKARLNAIIERLKVIGWEDELKHMDNSVYGLLGRLEQVNRSAELTSTDWKLICPQVVNFMKNSKNARLYRERRDSLFRSFTILQKAFREFRHLHVVRAEICPHLVDVCLEPEVQNLLDVVKNNTPERDLQQQLLGFFPSICARWRESIESRLSERISSCPRFRRGGKKFELASAIFRCITCGDALWYPAVLTHGCLNPVFSPEANLMPSDYVQGAAYFYCRQPFSAEVLDLNALSGITSKVIQLCGFNPKTATCDQMDQAHARLTCKSCNKNGRRKVMNWRTALDHSISGQCCHHFDHEGAWERVSDEEALKARELETAAEQMAAAEHASVISKDESNLRWSCDHCDGDKFWGRAGIITHLSNKHSISLPIEGDDYYRKSNPHPSGLLVEPVLLISDAVQLKRWERHWLAEGRAALHHFIDA